MRQLVSALLAMSSSPALNPTCKAPATKLLLTGDVMIGRGVDQILQFPSNPIIYEGYMKSALGYVAIAEKISGAIPRNVPVECTRAFAFLSRLLVHNRSRRPPNVALPIPNHRHQLQTSGATCRR